MPKLRVYYIEVIYMTSTSQPPKEDKDELTQLEREIISMKDPTQFIDFLAIQHYFAGQFGNKVPVDSARRMFEAWLARHDAERSREAEISGDTSDGYHTFNELYDYRRVYNAALFNEWHQQGGRHSVHKSWRHSDGELCFGGGWFVVVAELPTGQITNHYQSEYWDDFQIPEQETANTWDGHTPKEALQRLSELTNKREEKV